MASRSKKKQTMRPLGGQMRLESDIALTKAEINRIAAEQARMSGSFTAVRELQNERFRAGVDARRAVMAAIEGNRAMKDRVQEVYEEGRQAGFKQAAWPIIKCCMAGACLMLQHEFGIDDDEKIVNGLKDLHDRIVWALNYSELADDVLAKTGIELRLDDPLEPIQRI